MVYKWSLFLCISIESLLWIVFPLMNNKQDWSVEIWIAQLIIFLVPLVVLSLCSSVFVIFVSRSTSFTFLRYNIQMVGFSVFITILLSHFFWNYVFVNFMRL